MTNRALAAGNAAGSPEVADVSIAATFTFSNGTPITINSGNITDLKNGIVSFAITEPVVLGSVSDFVQWLTDRFGFPDINAEVLALKDEIKDNPLLSSLYSGFLSFYNGIIKILVLSINRTKTSYSYMLSVTLDLTPPIDFFGVIQFDSIGIAVNKAGVLTA
jgi:hypothetical protein